MWKRQRRLCWLDYFRQWGSIISLDTASIIASNTATIEAARLLAEQLKPAPVNQYIPALIGFAGVLVGAVSQIAINEVVAWRERHEKRATAKRDAGLSALILAQHLENYIASTRRVIITYKKCHSMNWDRESIDEYVEMHYLKPFPDWPKEINWKSSGLKFASKCSILKIKADLAYEDLQDDLEYLGFDDCVTCSATVAAKLANDAWQLASEIRSQNHLIPFPHDEWPMMDIVQEKLKEDAIIET